MSRELFESEEDRRIETDIANRFCEEWGWRAIKLSMKYRVDYMAIRIKGERPVAWVECRRRYCQSDKYPTILMSLDKWMYGQMLMRETMIPFLFFVQFDDRLMWTRCKLDHIPRTGYMGRNEERDQFDKEPCIMLPIERFEDLYKR